MKNEAVNILGLMNFCDAIRRGQVRHKDGAVAGPCGEPFSRSTKSGRVDRIGMLDTPIWNGFSRGCIPKPGNSVEADGENTATIGGK